MSTFTLADLRRTLYSKQRGGYYTDKVHIGSYCVNKLDIDFALEETPLVCKPFKELTLAFPRIWRKQTPWSKLNPTIICYSYSPFD